VENYLLEVDVLYDTVRQEGSPQHWPTCLSEAEVLFPELAKKQLRSVVIDEVYNELDYADIRLRKQDKTDDFAQSAQIIFSKIEQLKGQLDPLNKADWEKRFENKCKLRLNKKEIEWKDRWRELCNGKQFFRDLVQYSGGLGIDISSLKRRLIVANKEYENEGTKSWKALCGVLGDLLNKK
jgi:hypothetical protein